MTAQRWRVSFRGELNKRVLDALVARGATYERREEATATPEPTVTLLVTAPTGEDAVRLVRGVLEAHLISVDAYAVQSTPVND